MEEDVLGSVEKVGYGAASKNQFEEFFSIVEIEVYLFWLYTCSIIYLSLIMRI